MSPHQDYKALECRETFNAFIPSFIQIDNILMNTEYIYSVYILQGVYIFLVNFIN